MRKPSLTKGKCIVGFLLFSFLFGCGMVAGEYMTEKKSAEVPPTADQEAEDKLNLNTADYYELVELTGIGDAAAKAILDYRLENGGFNELADLVKLGLISQETAEKIADDVVVEFP